MKLLYVILSLLILFSCTKAENINKPMEINQMSEQKLPVCPDSPNCINTEYPEQSSHYLSPFIYPQKNQQQVMDLAKSIIIEMGGEIVDSTEHYISATFTSSFFKFIDDFEIRQDIETHKIHVRSASRVGYSDFGVNKKRVEAFFKRFKQQI